MKKSLLTLAAFGLVAASAFADTAYFYATATAPDGATSANSTQLTGTVAGNTYSADKVSITFEKHNSNTSNVNGNLVRWYQSDIIKITAKDGAAIAFTGIKMTCSSASYNKVAVTEPTGVDGTANGTEFSAQFSTAVSAVSLTATAQTRFSVLEIEYESTSSLPEAPISWPQETYTMAIGNPNLQSLVLTNTENLPVTYSSSDENVATVDADGQITLVAKGTTSISATFAGNDQYQSTTVSYSLEVKDWRQGSSITFAEEEYEVEFGTDFVSPIPNLMGATMPELVWSSSNEDVATVNELGKVTILAIGSTVITAVFDGNDGYQPASGSYTLKVMKSVVLPEGDKDVLTVSSFATLAASTKTSTYMEDSYTSTTTGITYSAQMAKNSSDSMQFRSSNSNSGMVVTSNPQNRILKAIVVEWDNNTAATRTVDFYGSDTAYTAPSDLYGDNKGTKFGSTAVEDGDDFIQEPDENYYFAGFRSNNSALWLTKVTFVWGTDTATGIAAVEAENGEAVYFDMMGRRVAEPTDGIFIKVQNGKAVKVLK